MSTNHHHHHPQPQPQPHFYLAPDCLLVKNILKKAKKKKTLNTKNKNKNKNDNPQLIKLRQLKRLID
jgi:hypothetical protein